MSLLTPDFGLLVWMTLIFGVVFVVLAKWGFPVITGMVRKRSSEIEKALAEAQDARDTLASLAEEQRRLLDETKAQQSRLIKEVGEMRARMIQSAKEQATEEANKIMAHARTEIAAMRETAMKDLSRQVSLLSIDIAEKVMRTELSKDEKQLELLDRLVKEASETNKLTN